MEEVQQLLCCRLQPAWLEACAAHLGGAAGSVQQNAKLVLQQLLVSDLNFCGAAALPPGVQVGAAGAGLQHNAFE